MTVSRPGRSPRMRGSLCAKRLVGGRVGSIPAHAGQPSPSSPSRAPSRVDPRACGAAGSNVYWHGLIQGRSPRMRGSHVEEPAREIGRGSIPAHAGSLSVLRDRRRGRGSIPAHAGQPFDRSTLGLRYGVDPRACGAAFDSDLRKHTSQGRSPRMRGSRAHVRHGSDEAGSIPAHAGQPTGSLHPGSCSGVDPRACGAARRFAVVLRGT